MFFRRIKKYLREKGESFLLAFEIVHFLLDLIIVIHILVLLFS